MLVDNISTNSSIFTGNDTSNRLDTGKMNQMSSYHIAKYVTGEHATFPGGGNFPVQALCR